MRRQRLVDLLALFQAPSSGTGEANALGPSQVNQVKLAHLSQVKQVQLPLLILKRAGV